MRTIDAVVGALDLRPFHNTLVSRLKAAPPVTPRMLLALWFYAVSERVGSAREIERRTSSTAPSRGSSPT